MFKWWEKIKKDAQEYEVLKLQLELSRENQKRFMKELSKKMKEKDKQKKRKVIEPLKETDGQTLIQLFKEYLRTDETHAQDVAQFCNCLENEDKEDFLNSFSEEEKEVIEFHLEHLVNYSDSLLENIMKEIKQEITKRNEEQ